MTTPSMRFKRILVVPGAGRARGSAVARAIAAAAHHRARLTFVEVLERWDEHVRDSLPAKTRREIEKAWHAERRRELEKLASSAGESGVAGATRLLEGTPFLEITREVQRRKHDLLIVGSIMSPGAASFGATTLHLLRKCPVPVWVVRATRRKTYRRILAAVRADPDDPQLDEQILGLAADLARTEAAELHVVHAWKLDIDDYLTRPSFMSKETALRYYHALEEGHKDHVERLLASVDTAGLHLTLHMERLSPADAIASVAEQTSADLLVMGSVRKSGIPGLLMGQTAETVLQRIRCALLAVKPAGFQSPISE